MSVRPQTRIKPAAASFSGTTRSCSTSITEDERMIRDTARAYAQDKLQPRIIRPIPKKTDREIFNEMGELGLIGTHAAGEYGCANASSSLWPGGARDRARR
jgi:glutaryl-CoA dehydrogenase